MSQSQCVYIDEFGTPDIDTGKEGVIPFLVYAAVVIEENCLPLAREVLDKIYQKYFSQDKYLKSSKITKNRYEKTIGILTELKELKHFVYAIVVDKKKIDNDSGLSYKTVFIKYFNNIIAQHLKSPEKDIHIVFDKTGDKAFGDSLEKYMEKHGVNATLFSNNTFSLLDDRTEEPLLQLADFYAGVLGKYYCGDFEEKQSNVIHETFIRKIASIEWFPWNCKPLFVLDSKFDSTFNYEITKIATNSAIRYIEENMSDRIGCAILQYILQETKHNPLRYISSKELKSNLLAQNIDIGDPIIRISELRNKGVLIVSPIGKKGYKFPNNEQEIADFYQRLLSNVVPQLRRCLTLNGLLLEQSNGQYNVLSKQEFGLLSELCKVVNDF